MMTKYTKFILSPHGDLVYKNTGQYVKKAYVVKDNRVYYKGRLKGYISKPSKKDADKLIKAMNKRYKYSTQLLKKATGEGLNVQDVHDITEMVNTVDMSHPVSNDQKQLFNFANHLYDMMESGYISENTANAWLDEYKRARTPSEKTKIWNRLKALQKDVGYEGSPI